MTRAQPLDTSIRYGDSLTDQQVFDIVCTHLAGMKERAGIGTGSNFTCSYRSPANSCCAVGHFLTDDEYSEEMEGLPARRILPERLFPLNDILTNLQNTHDMKKNWTGSREGMRLDLRTIAKLFKLDDSIIDTLYWIPSDIEHNRFQNTL